MSGKIAVQDTHLPSRRRANRRDGVPALTESDRQAQRTVLKGVVEALERMRADPAAARTTLVDLSDEQLVEYADSVLADLLATAFPGADAPKAKTRTFQKVQVGVYDARVHGSLVTRPFKDLPSLRSAAASHLKRITLEVRFVSTMRLTSDGRAHGNFSVESVHHDAIKALGAREAALQGKVEPVASLASLVLGLHSSNRWNEAVSTALLGSWTEPLLGETGDCPAALERLKAEAQVIHTQLAPLWRREARGSRLLLLDAPMGKDRTLYDLVAGCMSREDALPYDHPDDARLGVVLRALQPVERAVALARACPGVASWTEAALLAGAADPVAMGKRVGRKVNRLKARYNARAAAAVRQESVRAARSTTLTGDPESGERGE
jgi:hypothetical protein